MSIEKKDYLKIVLIVSLVAFIGLLIYVIRSGGTYISQRVIFNAELERDALKSEIDVLGQRCSYLSERLAEIEYAYADLQVQYEDILMAELERYNALAGKTALCGPGVIIFLEDGIRPLRSEEPIGNLVVHDSDIIKILIELRNAGAEALSVNDKRVILEKTPIKCIGPVIMIGDEKFAPPFIIKAIGDRKMLEATMKAPGSFLESLRVWGLGVEIDTALYLEIGSLDQ